MPAFTLYGARGSTNTDRVRLTLAEGGFTDYELSEEHVARHPWGKIPVVDFPNGFILHESRAICKYLARKYGFPLLPPASNAEATALFEQAEGIEMAYFAESAGTVAFEKFAKRFIGLPVDEAVVSKALCSVEAFLDVVAGSLLNEQEYMAGNSFTLVDIYYIPLFQRLIACGYGDIILSRQAVGDWWERCMSRPAIRQMVDADEKAALAAKR
ncbi:hypothetical protein PWT90_06118 [Aphanocladium album]|nr:hypothetical protein PWT90_06118 [Aphanocladium album]